MLLKFTTRSLCGLAVAGLVLANATAFAGITHRYSFNDGTANDSVGLAHGTLMNGATIAGGQLALTGGAGQAAPHLSLLANGANGINIATYSALTVEFWATHNANTGNTWSRYFDFGSHNIVAGPAEGVNAGNSIFLTADAGGNNGGTPPIDFAQRMAISNVNIGSVPSQSGFNNEQSASFAGPEALAGVEHHVVGVFDESTDTMTVYLNGLQIAQNTGVTHTMSVLQNDGALAGLTDFALIGAALYPDAGWNGTFNEVRIYDMAFGLPTILASGLRGPDGAPMVPEPAAGLLMLMGLAVAAVARRRG